MAAAVVREVDAEVPSESPVDGLLRRVAGARGSLGAVGIDPAVVLGSAVVPVTAAPTGRAGTAVTTSLSVETAERVAGALLRVPLHQETVPVAGRVVTVS